MPVPFIMSHISLIENYGNLFCGVKWNALFFWLQLALSFVVQESFKLYKALSEGIINLADTFFKMPYLEGMRAQEVYNEAVCGGEALKKYHAKLQQMDAVKSVLEFPEFEVPPADFLETMQEHLLTLKKENVSNLLVRLLYNSALFAHGYNCSLTMHVIFLYRIQNLCAKAEYQN
jgi:hypothetical protein